jgi:DNA polymerase III epsilon subunit-like protein
MRINIFDTETTGLLQPENSDLSMQPKIIEFYGVQLNEEFEILEEVNELIHVDEPLSSTIIRVTGIKDADLLGKPYFGEVSDKIANFFDKADLSVAHNHGFDRGMLDVEFRRLGLECPAAKRDLCTVEATMGMTGHRLSLTRLHWILFKKQFDAHRAKDDVFALVRCFHHLVEEGVIKLEHYTD